MGSIDMSKEMEAPKRHGCAVSDGYVSTQVQYSTCSNHGLVGWGVQCRLPRVLLSRKRDETKGHKTTTTTTTASSSTSGRAYYLA